ncbi:hypothetical protein H5410_055806 [Solanum commersonii]|uniref:Uncharacterized protein n=1 Tax=Solanum commersonii TaxID=4109 RepID=A0A9J5WKW3_SOLCO|nr:hypothetical protein H5410_055806 [Solanum commersonii]
MAKKIVLVAYPFSYNWPSTFLHHEATLTENEECPIRFKSSQAEPKKAKQHTACNSHKIDRILISLEWNEHFNNIKQTLLQFYHVPLALFVGPRNIQNLISTLKIRALTEEESVNSRLFSWIMKNYIFMRRLHGDKVYKLDEIPNQKLLTEVEITKRFSLSKEFEDIARHEEIAWRQRSRTLWLKQGDRNTIFFHKTANAHKRVKTLIS